MNVKFMSLNIIDVSPMSSTNEFRVRRFANFLSIVKDVISEKGSCNILDIGGVHDYWAAFGSQLPEQANVTLLNLRYTGAPKIPNFEEMIGDACGTKLADNSFDIVHSNSVIEHVGLWDRMEMMASEIRRIAPRYFVQTPNYWFPIEAHARVPFFHLLPEPVRVSILLRRGFGFLSKGETVGEATKIAQSAFLLDFRQMSSLFPDALIEREQFFGFTKSLVAIKR